MLKRILACVLVLGTALLHVCGCSGSEESAPEITADTAAGTAAETEAPSETDITDELPDKDFGGAVYTMTGVDYATRRNFANEDESGEIVNDALAARDLAISERYNVSIKTIAEDSADKINSNVKKAVQAGDHAYDFVISSISGSMISLMTGNLLYDLSGLEALSLDKPWWSPGMYENTRLNGTQYITTGDISPMKYYAPYCLAYNCKLCEDYLHTDIDSSVLDGKWTTDAFDKMITDSNSDLNGDGIIDGSDFFGYAHVNTEITAFSHYVGAGQKLSVTSSDGNVEIPINTQASVSVIEKCGALISRSPGYPASDDKITISMFKEDRALFFGNSYSNIIANFRDMESDFTVIPTPKLDEAQPRYYSYINTWALSGTAVPANITDPEMVGTVTEALCRYSYRDVRPDLYETVIKVKVARGDVDAVLLDIVFDNTYVDFNGIFNLGGSASAVANAILTGSDFMSAYAKIENKIQGDIEKYLSFGG